MPLPDNDEMFNTKGQDAAGYHDSVRQAVWQRRLSSVILPPGHPMISSVLPADGQKYGDEIWYV